MDKTDRFKGKAKTVHTEVVRDYVEKNYPGAKRVNVRYNIFLDASEFCTLTSHNCSKVAHNGGTKASEPEHITASVKGSGRLNQTVHIYPPLGWPFGSQTSKTSWDAKSEARLPK